jgi:putative membrane protein
MKFQSIVLAGALLAAPLVPLSAYSAGKMSSEDQATLKKLAQGDLAEMKAGKMAEQRAQSDEVKRFGAQMAKDHGRMLEEKKRMAKAKGVTLPRDPDPAQKAEAQKLQGMAKQDFDREYMGHMVKDHTEDLELVRKTAQEAKDPQLKAAAGKAEPMIAGHLEMAKSIEASLDGSSRGGSK